MSTDQDAAPVPGGPLRIRHVHEAMSIDMVREVRRQDRDATFWKCPECWIVIAVDNPLGSADGSP